MIKLALVAFSAVVLVLLAADWIIHENLFRWQCAALAAFVIVHLPFSDVAVPVRKKSE